MKDPAATIAIAADRTALANAASPAICTVIHLINLLLVDGHVVPARPRPGAPFNCAGKKAEHAERARGHHQFRFLGPAALDLVGPSNERTGAYVTSHH